MQQHGQCFSISSMVKRHARYKLNENTAANKYARKAVEKE